MRHLGQWAPQLDLKGRSGSFHRRCGGGWSPESAGPASSRSTFWLLMVAPARRGREGPMRARARSKACARRIFGGGLRETARGA